MTLSDHGPDASPPLRLIIQQPVLPKYRVPLFRELARRPGLHVRLIYGDMPGAPANGEPDGFEAQCVHMLAGRVLGRPVFWHPPQWQYATPAQADVLMLSWNLHYASLVPALLRARANGVPTILWGHGYSKRDARWRRLPRTSVAKLATALVFYSRGVARDYERAGFDPGRLFVALNAIDQAPVQAARQHWLGQPGKLRVFQEQRGLLPGPGILFVSRLDHERRVDLLLRAAKELTGQFPALRVVLVGDGPERGPLEALARELGLADRVVFAGAIYNEMELAPWMLSSQVFCFPANIGLSLLHAFGYGLPVVTAANRQEHGPEIEALRDGENGLLYADGDVAALAAALRRVLSDDALRERLSAGARRTVTEEFTLQRMVEGMEAAVRYCARPRR